MNLSSNQPTLDALHRNPFRTTFVVQIIGHQRTISARAKISGQHHLSTLWPVVVTFGHGGSVAQMTLWSLNEGSHDPIFKACLLSRASYLLHLHDYSALWRWRHHGEPQCGLDGSDNVYTVWPTCACSCWTVVCCWLQALIWETEIFNSLGQAMISCKPVGQFSIDSSFHCCSYCFVYKQ